MSNQELEQEETGAASVRPVEFPQADATRKREPGSLPLQTFYNVNVDISVELGHATLPLGELLRLGEGEVVELERLLSDPVDVVAQGVRIARGEVVVIEDRFAIRITEIENASPPPAAAEAT